MCFPNLGRVSCLLIIGLFCWLCFFLAQKKVLDTADLSSTQIVRLCRLYLSDYCCFGFEMPQVCLDSASEAAGVNFTDTDAVCDHATVDSQWAQRGSPSSPSDTQSFFDPLPTPRQPPHLYGGSSRVVASYQRSVAQLVS